MNIFFCFLLWFYYCIIYTIARFNQRQKNLNCRLAVLSERFVWFRKFLCGKVRKCNKSCKFFLSEFFSSSEKLSPILFGRTATLFDCIMNIQKCFQMLWKVYEHSGSFPCTLENFQTTWKVGYSGIFLNTLESFVHSKLYRKSQNFQNILESLNTLDLHYWMIYSIYLQQIAMLLIEGKQMV